MTTTSSVTFVPLIVFLLAIAVIAIVVVVVVVIANRSSTVAEGWYPDPYGQAAWRFWDGRAWTGYLA